MNVQELCSKLAYGKLANLSMSGAGEPTGEIEVQHRPAVIEAINSALVRLHSRFVLKENGLMLSMRDHITRYHLTSKYTESRYPTEGVEIPYILDTPDEPFNDDLIRVIAVYDTFGRMLPLNDTTCSTSIYTPQYNVIQTSTPRNNELLNVIYQANHVKLSHEHPLEEVVIPDVLFDAMTAYIAYTVFSSISTQESMMKAAEQMALYENIAAEVENRDGVSNTIIPTNTKLDQRGWV